MKVCIGHLNINYKQSIIEEPKRNTYDNLSN